PCARLAAPALSLAAAGAPRARPGTRRPAAQGLRHRARARRAGQLRARNGRSHRPLDAIRLASLLLSRIRERLGSVQVRPHPDDLVAAESTKAGRILMRQLSANQTWADATAPEEKRLSSFAQPRPRYYDAGLRTNGREAAKT